MAREDWSGKLKELPDPEAVPHGDGRSSRHQVHSVLVVDDGGEMWLVVYSDLRSQKIGFHQGGEFRLRFFDVDQQAWDLIVTGSVEAVQKLIDKLATGKRELIYPSPDTIESIRFVQANTFPEEN